MIDYSAYVQITEECDIPVAGTLVVLKALPGTNQPDVDSNGIGMIARPYTVFLFSRGYPFAMITQDLESGYTNVFYENLSADDISGLGLDPEEQWYTAVLIPNSLTTEEDVVINLDGVSWSYEEWSWLDDYGVYFYRLAESEDPGEDPDEPGQGTEQPDTNTGTNTQHYSYTTSDSITSDVFIKVLSVLGLFIFVGILFYISSFKSEKKKTRK